MLIPDALYQLGRCGASPTSPPCQWDCQADSTGNPTCANQETCTLEPSQIVAALQGRFSVRVNDDTCTGGPAPHTRLSLRIRSPDGTDFSVPDRLLNLCSGVPGCGPCDPDATCTAPPDASCPLDPVFLCGAFAVNEFSEAVLQGNVGIGLELWLNYYQVIPASITSDIATQFPAAAGTVPVIFGAKEILSAAVDNDPNHDLSSKREYCLNIWLVNLPDPARTTIPNLVGQTSASSLADMGPCGCGDGLVETGEECDDGNTTPGDGCDASCRREACWTCGGGNPCTPVAAKTACRQPAPLKALLLFKDKANDSRDLARWKWVKGAATPPDALGDPLATDSYDLCVYQDAGAGPLLFGMRAPAGGTCDGKPCWTTRKDGGFQYGSKTGTPGGLTKLVLKPGADGRARIVAKGKGSDLHLPSLPLTLPALAQLQRVGTAECWDATYSAAGALKNDAAQFKGKSN